MPELPEVENFRRLLLPLVSKTDPLHLERLSLDKKPPRKFLSDDDIQHINQHKYLVQDVLRRGKLICMVLEPLSSSSSSDDDNDNAPNTVGTKYLYVHMGMTGRISTKEYVPTLQELKKDADYPPPCSYLKFSSSSCSSSRDKKNDNNNNNNGHEACFSDPRKFGSILLATSKEELDQLAPDACTEITDTNRTELLEKLSNQSMGIKPLLLDQKRVVSGVGNWVADEVLYQTQIHPDQNYLTVEQADNVLTTLQHDILQIAVDCLGARQDFPNEWLFHYRWNSKKTTKDAEGRVVTFITSGGRTSAVVPSIQKKKKNNNNTASAKTKTTSKKRKSSGEDVVAVVEVVKKPAAKKAKKAIKETKSKADVIPSSGVHVVVAVSEEKDDGTAVLDNKSSSKKGIVKKEDNKSSSDKKDGSKNTGASKTKLENGKKKKKYSKVAAQNSSQSTRRRSPRLFSGGGSSPS